MRADAATGPIWNGSDLAAAPLLGRWGRREARAVCPGLGHQKGFVGSAAGPGPRRWCCPLGEADPPTRGGTSEPGGCPASAKELQRV